MVAYQVAWNRARTSDVDGRPAWLPRVWEDRLRDLQRDRLAAAALAAPAPPPMEGVEARVGPLRITRREALSILSYWAGGPAHHYPSPVTPCYLIRYERWVMAPRGIPSVTDREVVDLLNWGSRGPIHYGEVAAGGPPMTGLCLDEPDPDVGDRLHTMAAALYELRTAGAGRHPVDPDYMAAVWAASRSVWARALCGCDALGAASPPRDPLSAGHQRRQAVIYKGYHPDAEGPHRAPPAPPPAPAAPPPAPPSSGRMPAPRRPRRGPGRPRGNGPPRG